MTDEQFHEAMAERRETLDLGPNDHIIGCPLCGAPLVAPVLDDEDDSNEVAAND